MIAHLKGKLIAKSSTEIVIECSGVGFSANVSLSASEKLPPVGSEATVLTLLIMRDDAVILYGFWCAAERELFKMLISVSGVGPKTALGILSAMTIEDFRENILTNNLLALNRLPGIGKKSAERLVIELRDKIVTIDTGSKEFKPTASSQLRHEAAAALVTLGYSRQAAEKAVKNALDGLDGKDISVESIIKNALRFAMNLQR